METLVNFIERLAAKAGIANTDPHLTEFLSNAALASVTIPSELATGIDNNILSLTQAADNHPVLKRQYHAQVLNAFDKKLDAIMKDAGLSPETIANLEREQNTYNRFDQLTHAIKESAALAKAAKTPEDKGAAQKQVDDLLAQLRNTQAESATQIAQINDARQKDRISYELRSMLGGVRTVFDELPPQAKQAALDSLITKALHEKGASFGFDEAGAFTLKGAEDTAVVGANNNKYTPDTFIQEILAQNKILKVADPAGPPTPTNPQSNGRMPMTVRGNTALSGGNTTTADANRQAREAFMKQS